MNSARAPRRTEFDRVNTKVCEKRTRLDTSIRAARGRLDKRKEAFFSRAHELGGVLERRGGEVRMGSGGPERKSLETLEQDSAELAMDAKGQEDNCYGMQRIAARAFGILYSCVFILRDTLCGEHGVENTLRSLQGRVDSWEYPFVESPWQRAGFLTTSFLAAGAIVGVAAGIILDNISGGVLWGSGIGAVIGVLWSARAFIVNHNILEELIGEEVEIDQKMYRLRSEEARFQGSLAKAEGVLENLQEALSVLLPKKEEPPGKP